MTSPPRLIQFFWRAVVSSEKPNKKKEKLRISLHVAQFIAPPGQTPPPIGSISLSGCCTGGDLLEKSFLEKRNRSPEWCAESVTAPAIWSCDARAGLRPFPGKNRNVGGKKNTNPRWRWVGGWLYRSKRMRMNLLTVLCGIFCIVRTCWERFFWSWAPNSTYLQGGVIYWSGNLSHRRSSV